MTVSESERRDIYNSLETVIGLQAANNLMQLLPYKSADELTTRADMHAQTSMLRGEMAELRGELQGEMAELRAELRGDMAELRGELQGDMAELRTELKGDMAELRGELKGDMLQLENRLETSFEKRFTQLRISTQRLVVASMAGNTVAVVTALVA